MEDIKSCNKKKIYRGAYTYSNNHNVFAEEIFEVFNNPQEMTYHFESEMHSRVASGELLSIKVNYTADRNYLPKTVEITRSLGDTVAIESYVCNKSNKIEYSFQCGEEATKETYSTPPRFNIATPTMATTFLFLLSKKFDATAKNIYSIFSSKNLWTFDSPVVHKSITLEKTSTTPVDEQLGDKNITGDLYRMFGLDDENATINKEDEADHEIIEILMSKHLAFPYRVSAPDGTEITIKYLNDLTDSD